jgi:flagellar biosynthesis protein FlhB
MRRRGSAPVSRDLVAAVVLAGVLVVAKLTGGVLLARFCSSIASLFGALPASAGPNRMASAAVLALVAQAVAVAVVAGSSAALGTVCASLQTGGLLAPKAVAFQPSRLDPIKGLRRLFSVRSLLELIKALVRTAALLIVAWWSLPLHSPARLDSLGTATLHSLERMCTAFTLVLLALGLLDLLLQRWLHERDNRMTRDELRRETREDEGDPNLKAARRRLHREMGLWANLHGVRTARLLVVNPTHVAAALGYDPAHDSAPTVLAKGAGLMAWRMRRIAAENGVPIFEQRELARALFRLAVDDAIPPRLYADVAGLLVAAERMAGTQSGEEEH